VKIKFFSLIGAIFLASICSVLTLTSCKCDSDIQIEKEAIYAEVPAYILADYSKGSSYIFMDKMIEFFAKNNEEFANYYFNSFALYFYSGSYFVNEIREFIKDIPENDDDFQRMFRDFPNSKMKHIIVFLHSRENSTDRKILIFSLENLELYAQYTFILLDEKELKEKLKRHRFFDTINLQSEFLSQKTN